MAARRPRRLLLLLLLPLTDAAADLSSQPSEHEPRPAVQRRSLVASAHSTVSKRPQRQACQMPQQPQPLEELPLMQRPQTLLGRECRRAVARVRYALRSDALRHLLAGAAAGAISNTAVAPLDILRINLMVAQDKTNALRVARGIFDKGGVLGFWQGNSADVLRTMPSSAIRFYTFALYKVRAGSVLHRIHRRVGRARLVFDVSAPPLARHATAPAPSCPSDALQSRRIATRCGRRSSRRFWRRWGYRVRRSRRCSRVALPVSPRWRRSSRLRRCALAWRPAPRRWALVSWASRAPYCRKKACAGSIVGCRRRSYRCACTSRHGACRPATAVATPTPYCGCSS